MQRYFSGRPHITGAQMNRREAIGGMAGAATAVATRNSRAPEYATPDQPCNSQAGEYEPTPERIKATQTFHLNFTVEQGSHDITSRIASVLKRLGRKFDGLDMGALGHTIASTEFGQTATEDGTVVFQWHRPTPDNLTVKANIEVSTLIADLPAKWALPLLG